MYRSTCMLVQNYVCSSLKCQQFIWALQTYFCHYILSVFYFVPFVHLSESVLFLPLSESWGESSKKMVIGWGMATQECKSMIACNVTNYRTAVQSSNWSNTSETAHLISSICIMINSGDTKLNNAKQEITVQI